MGSKDRIVPHQRSYFLEGSILEEQNPHEIARTEERS